MRWKLPIVASKLTAPRAVIITSRNKRATQRQPETRPALIREPHDGRPKQPHVAGPVTPRLAGEAGIRGYIA